MATISIPSTRYSLFQKAKAGDSDAENAVNDLCSIYYPIVIAWCCKYYGRNLHDANDLAQNLFIKIRTIIQNYDRKAGKFRSYLAGALKIQNLNDFRKRGKQIVVVSTEVVEQASDLDVDNQSMDELVTEIESAHSQEQKMMLEALANVKAKVQSKTWFCFHLRQWSNLSSKEIAEELNQKLWANLAPDERAKQLKKAIDSVDQNISRVRKHLEVEVARLASIYFPKKQQTPQGEDQ